MLVALSCIACEVAKLIAVMVSSSDVATGAVTRAGKSLAMAPGNAIIASSAAPPAASATALVPAGAAASSTPVASAAAPPVAQHQPHAARSAFAQVMARLPAYFLLPQHEGAAGALAPSCTLCGSRPPGRSIAGLP